MRPASCVSVAVALSFGAGAHCGTTSSSGSALHGAPDGSSESSSVGADGGGAVDAGPLTVTPFDKTLFAFNGAPGGARRTTVPAAFPTGAFQHIGLTLRLDCPSGGGCDHWDRTGSLGVVTQPAVDGGSHGTVVEIARWITPFGVAAGPWEYDLTDLAPLLSGDVILQGFIDTWSPQAQPLNNGAGWLLTATFTFTPGTPAKIPVANLPVWSWPADSDPSSVPYGDPEKPLSSYMKPQTLTLPASASSYSLRSFITGHGQGSAKNCAEFCPATHTVTVGSTAFTKTPWRTCCTPDPKCENSANPQPAAGVTPGQLGTYMYPRSGWCPGSAVEEWTQDVTQAVGSGSGTTLAWAFDSYVNGCRPDVDDAGTCTSCEPGITCSYDGSGHTEPIFYISSLLVAYR